MDEINQPPYLRSPKLDQKIQKMITHELDKRLTNNKPTTIPHDTKHSIEWDNMRLQQVGNDSVVYFVQEELYRLAKLWGVPQTSLNAVHLLDVQNRLIGVLFPTLDTTTDTDAHRHEPGPKAERITHTSKGDKNMTSQEIHGKAVRGGGGGAERLFSGGV